jgi:hypothetical protein
MGPGDGEGELPALASHTPSNPTKPQVCHCGFLHFPEPALAVLAPLYTWLRPAS